MINICLIIFKYIYHLWWSMNPDVLLWWSMGSIVYKNIYRHTNTRTDNDLLISARSHFIIHHLWWSMDPDVLGWWSMDHKHEIIYPHRNIRIYNDQWLDVRLHLDIFHLWQSRDQNVLLWWSMGSILHDILYLHKHILIDNDLFIYAWSHWISFIYVNPWILTYCFND